MKRRAGRPPKDSRVNAPLLSWRVTLLTMVLVALLMFGESMIITYLQDYLPVMIGSLVYYALIFWFVLAITFAVIKRYVYGKSINTIAQAARRVAQGDYSVRLTPSRKDGKKDEIEVLIEDFNHMAQELGSVEVLKSDFVANVSHEIKTPLSVIQNYAAALKDATLSPEERSAYASTIMDASRRLSAMVTNILQLNKLDEQRLLPPGPPYQLGEQLRRCALQFLDQWQAKEIAFAIDVEDVLVPYDESMLELVWNNLISNAVKFTDPGGTITLTSAWRDGAMIVRIRDTGCGMDEATQERIFDRFYQGDHSHRTAGNGLGLALVKRALELAGGEIAAESQPGKGSTFTVRLPLPEPDEAARQV